MTSGKKTFFSLIFTIGVRLKFLSIKCDTTIFGIILFFKQKVQFQQRQHEEWTIFWIVTTTTTTFTCWSDLKEMAYKYQYNPGIQDNMSLQSAKSGRSRNGTAPSSAFIRSESIRWINFPWIRKGLAISQMITLL